MRISDWSSDVCSSDLDYREMLFTAAGAEQYVSGVILYDETLRQKAKDGTPLVDILNKRGIIPGIKVDKGVQALPGSAGEKDRKSTRLNSSHFCASLMPSSACTK